MVGIGTNVKWGQFVWKKEWSYQIATWQELQEYLTKETERRWDKSWNKKGKKWIGNMKTEKKGKWNEMKVVGLQERKSARSSCNKT